MALVTQHSL